MEIKNKVVIITGASDGIGLAAAKLFAQHGAKVALTARSIDKLNAISKDLPGSFAIKTDMRNENDIHNMIQSVHNHYGRIDVLINNAGQGMHVSIENTDRNKFRSIIELNIIGVLSAMQEVIPIMRSQKSGGVIINISSGLSKRIVPTVGPYAATKYALNAISLTARMELAKDNIRVGIVIPGVTATNFFRNTISNQITSTQRSGHIVADSPEHVADKILEAVNTEAAEVYADSTKPIV